MLGQNLKRLAEEIAASYEARVQGIADLKVGTGQLKQEAGELLKGFSKRRQNMAGDTRTELSLFKRDCQQEVAHLKNAAKNLIEGMARHQQEVKKAIREELVEFRSGLSRYKDGLDAAEEQRKQDAGEEIAARVGLIGDIQKETRADLTGFQDARQEMWKDLKTRLGALMEEIRQFQADLANAEMDRKTRVRGDMRNASEAIRARLSDLMKGLRKFQSDLVKGETERKHQSQRHLKDVRVELNTLFRNLRKDLGRFRTDLEKTGRDRKRTTLGELKEMSQDLRARLAEFRDNISTTVGDFLGELKSSRTENSAAWREILSEMRGEPGAASVKISSEKTETTKAPQPKKAGPEEVKAPKPETLPKAGAIVPPQEGERKGDASLSAQDGFMEGILALLNDHPEGLKMVEISEELGLPNWRSLIPVMRQLMDEEEVRKEETLYFAE